MFRCLIAAAIVVLGDAATLPSYISACSRSDPQLDECMVKNANAALPSVLKGDAEYSIPSMLPLRVPEIRIESEHGLHLRFTDCELHGLEAAHVQRMLIDFAERRASIEVHIDRLTVLASYNVSGRVLVLPIEGKGPANVTIAGGKYRYEFEYELMRRPKIDNKEYMRFVSHDLQYDAQRAYIRLEKLFNGDKQLGDTLNRFLDENWRDVTAELYPSLRTAVGAIVTSIAKGLFSKISFDQIFTGNE